MGGAEIAPTHMHAYHHVVRAVLDRLAHHPGIAFDQPVGIDALFCLARAVFGIAEIGKEDVVHLQIPATGLVELGHRIAVGGRQIIEDRLWILFVVLRVNVIGRSAEMAAGGTRNRDFWHYVGMLRNEFEVFQHRVIVGKAQLVDDRWEDWAQFDACELDTFFAFLQFQSVQHAHEVIMPKRSAGFAVGHGLQPGILLHAD